MNEQLLKKNVFQNIGNRIFPHPLEELKLINIMDINNKKKELYKEIEEENRIYKNTNEILNHNEIEKFYFLAKQCFKNAGITYDKGLEINSEIWKECHYFENNNKHKNKKIEISNFGRVKVDGEIKPQCEEKQDSGYLYIKEFGVTLKVWTLVAETWLIKPETNCKLDVHHLSNNGYDQRPENLIWLTRCEHKVIHPNMSLCNNCSKPLYLS